MFSGSNSTNKNKKRHTSDDVESTKQDAFERESGYKPKRISKSWVSSQPWGNELEGKFGQHNLFGADDPGNPSSVRAHLATTEPAKRYSNLLEPNRISSRPLFIVRRSDLDILRFQEGAYDRSIRETKGKYVAIPIIPADEMVNLTREIKLWNKSRKSFKLVFAIALICGLVLLAGSITISFLWYGTHDLSLIDTKNFTRPGTGYINLHMNAQMLNLILMAFGLNTFRLLPRVKLDKIICYHALIFVMGFTFGVGGIYLAVLDHYEFTKLDAHFYSIHSWLGLTAFAFIILSFATGTLFLYYPSNTLKSVHNQFSMLCFMLHGVTVTVGIFERTILQLGEHYRYMRLHGVIVNSMGVLVVVFVLLVRLAASSFIFRRTNKPQYDVIVYRSMEAIEDVYLEIHEMYDSFELWVKQVNIARLKALKVPHYINTYTNTKSFGDEREKQRKESTSTG